MIAGQDEMLERVFVCLLAGGHLLIEGVPGLAKTLTIKTVADVLGGTFQRVQFTPDLVPSDLVGTRMYRGGKDGFETELGPVFCNFLLADEINRAPAKVQSALLEVMQERQVTIGKETHAVPSPFLVMATQNPIESEGTYPLPEAQVDRFMLKVLVDYPAPADELTVIERALAEPVVVERLLSIEDLAELQVATRRVYVDPAVSRYALSIATRDAAARRDRARGARRLRRVRRQPPRPDQPRPRRPCARAPARTPLRAPAGRARAREGRAPAPARAQLRGARRGRGRGADPRPRARDGPDAAARPLAAGRRMSTVHALRPTRTPGRPGPGPLPAALLRKVDLTVRRRIDGLLAGDHRSWATGDGTELAQVRPYAPGDDVRLIDWNVTARTGEPHVRVNVAERAVETWLLLDTSASMTFGTADRRKWDVAEGVSLAVGHFAVRRGNRLALATFGDRNPVASPARQGNRGLLALLPALRREPDLEPVGPTSLGSALARIGRLARRRAVIVIVSDFRGPRDWRPRLLQLAARHDVVAVEIQDPREQELPDVGDLWLVDPESGRQLRVDTRSRKLRERFDDEAAADREALARELRSLGVPHLTLSTSGDWLRRLVGFLQTEGRRR